ncbi:hypothetical protein PanWU01x14_209750 [Parasponia andersonii]|uniref:Uncharacterized protein n=1 Tax=Parasponia andersonii TaxID=3476 RepID=A0A2P5BUC4_PARAD|nr:hypothetical protein PanWU01x14_209750 [Parasponia andersonii]
MCCRSFIDIVLWSSYSVISLCSPETLDTELGKSVQAIVNQETRELMSPIDYFKSCYLKPSDWQNEQRWLRLGQRRSLKLSLVLSLSLGMTITTLKQQLAKKDVEHAWQIYETQQQMAEKEAENQRRLEETLRQLNEQSRMLQILIAKLGIEMPLAPPIEL